MTQRLRSIDAALMAAMMVPACHKFSRRDWKHVYHDDSRRLVHVKMKASYSLAFAKVESTDGRVRLSSCQADGRRVSVTGPSDGVLHFESDD